MADDPIIQRARETKFYQDGLRELGRNLPSQDEELDRVLTQAVETKDDRAFTHLILAALAVGRKVDAHHLIEGAILFPGLRPFAAAALHCSGNVAQALLEAVARGGFLPRTEAGVLAVAMVWCEDHPAEPIPRELITRARMRAREVGPEQLPAIELLSISKRCRDEALQSILEKAGQGGYQQIADEILDSLFTESRASPLAPVPAQPEAVAISGYTVRRSAPRIGRNDLCPCGSGKKYKKCCYDKDQERLRHPSAVPGLTVDEWRTVPELGLTEARLSQMRPFELSRLDPLKIPEKLRWPFLDQLVMSDQVEAAVVAFEKFGYRPNYQLPWRFGLRLATRAGLRDLVERLFRVRTDDQTEEDFSLSARLLLASESDNQLLQMVEKEARAAIQAESTAPLAELAYSMLDSQAPSLGILVARSVLPIVPELEAITIFDAVLKTRDRLDLPPDDPFDQILDARLLGPVDETAATSQELKHARAGLEAKNEEVRKLAQELERLKRALEPGEAPKPKHAEAKSPPSPVSLPTPTPTPALDERSLAQMRQRMNSLRDMLKERHMERNQLRRELQAAQAQIQALHDKPSESPTALSGAVPSPEDEFLVPSDEEFSSQPVRIPEFPRKFQNTLAALPKPIARACLGLIGRMAGGEAAAFGGSKRLKTAPEIHRQRLAGDYRLLFRLHSDRFEVIDLIHRRDLERKIKSLT